MYNNILVPVSFDESRNVAQAVQAATTLASDDARITFLHVLQTLPHYISDHLPSDVLETNQSTIKAQMAKLTKQVPNAFGHVKTGHPGNTILSWAKDHDIDCIIVASHQPEMADYLLGSTAQMVVRHAKCCVHIVR